MLNTQLSKFPEKLIFTLPFSEVEQLFGSSEKLMRNSYISFFFFDSYFSLTEKSRFQANQKIQTTLEQIQYILVAVILPFSHTSLHKCTLVPCFESDFFLAFPIFFQYSDAGHSLSNSNLCIVSADLDMKKVVIKKRILSYHCIICKPAIFKVFDWFGKERL